MCKEYQKKYESYKIIITFLNGDTEKINYKGVNTSSYKEMMKLYKDIKEEYKSESVTIDFMGQTLDGELGILFQKKIVSEDLKLKEYGEKIANTPVKNIIENIVNNFKLLDDRYNFTKEQVDILNKKQDIELHKIECLDDDTDESLKLFIVNTLQELRKNRRELKEEQLFTKELFSSLTKGNINCKHTKNVLNEFLEKQENKKEIKYEILTEEKVEELKIMRKISYKNFKDKIIKMKKLQKNYDKVYCDDSKMEIICYNKAKVC